jgi:4-nitrophenyl phosphatase
MIRGVILDLDGTVYVGERAVPGAAAFVARARRWGLHCLFVTNRASRTPATVARQLRLLGIPCRASDVFTSADATANHIRRGSVFMVGERGLRVALRKAGIVLTDKRPDWVVVSLDRAFTYRKLATATRCIGAGSRFIATNADRGLPTEAGLVPGTGAHVAAMSAATGRAPLVIGKPQPAIMRMALRHMGLRARDVISVGDNVETDVPAGIRAGMRTALLLTGVSDRRAARRSPIEPTWIFNNYGDLARLVERELGAGGRSTPWSAPRLPVGRRNQRSSQTNACETP